MGCVSLGKCYPVLFEGMADFPRNEVKIKGPAKTTPCKLKQLLIGVPMNFMPQY